MFFNNVRISLKPNILISRIPAISSSLTPNVNLSQKSLISNLKSRVFPDTYKLINVFYNIPSIRSMSTEKFPKNKDVFGDLGHWNFNKVEMDEAEEAEEKFTENEARLPRRHRLSPGRYADLIKSYIQKLDLPAALGVLDLTKDNRDKPTVYMYNLLIRAFAVQGDMKQCFKLYNAMKKRALKPNEATYTSLLNSIANSLNTKLAMENLKQLRTMFLEKGIILNDTHYNAMINAYGRHNKSFEAFQMADEMKDRRMQITECTFNTLLCCAISNKEAGIRFALMVWHLMKLHKIKPSTKTYNLLLRAIKETKFGNLKVDHVLISGEESSRINYKVDERPNLLASPPVVSSVPLVKMNKPSENKANPKMVAKLEKSLLSQNLKNGEMVTVDQDLNTIHKHNSLILFGGFENILKVMKEDGVEPDVKTMTYLMELAPNSVIIEKMITERAYSYKIPLDIEFFNVLMKKRCYRHEYDSARQVLHDIQSYNLQPDIVTWGTLALTCDFPEEAFALIETMEGIGFMPNSIILGTLLIKASRSKSKDKFENMLNLMYYMKKNDLKPTTLTLEKLNAFQKEVRELIRKKDKSISKKFKDSFKKFCEKYVEWRDTMEEKKYVHETYAV